MDRPKKTPTAAATTSCSMPGPQAYEKWKSTPVTAHIYRFVKGNEMESQMAFDRWVVEFAHNSVRRECAD
ncbi:hypothetical protein ACFY2Y_15450 [Janibacter hoylei]|uniref:hypothetical protein n=1 Tax=Janibacter hoylei TaxID=364298 RepID=UPI0036A5845A